MGLCHSYNYYDIYGNALHNYNLEKQIYLALTKITWKVSQPLSTTVKFIIKILFVKQLLKAAKHGSVCRIIKDWAVKMTGSNYHTAGIYGEGILGELGKNHQI